jgi:unsaturated rhamnogalacturonyl hydrolase
MDHYQVGTARCAVRAASSGAMNVESHQTLVCSARCTRAGTSQRDVSTNSRVRASIIFSITFLAALIFTGCATSTSKSKHSEHFSNWPAGASPQEIGKRLAENFLPRPFRFETNASRASLGVIYPEVIGWYGSLTVAKLIGDKDLTARLTNKFERFFNADIRFINHRAHVDYRVLGTVPLEMYMQTGDKRYLDLGLKLADAQWTNTTPDGITSEARYWIDDMYMIPIVQAQAFRVTKDMKYLDRAALAMASYLDRLQQPNGLFYHGTNAPFYWSRGNGWMAAGSAELLRDLPKNHKHYATIMAGYQKMMASLLKYQGDDGLWHQLIDHPESWSETSGTAMFAFGMVTGVKNGWLDEKTYGPAARKAWLGLVRKIDANGNVQDVCAGTDKGDTLEFYLNRPRLLGDLHAQSPVLWTASALMR